MADGDPKMRPTEPQDEAPVSSSTAAPTPVVNVLSGTTQGTILVVEDSPTQRQVIIEILEEGGYTVLWAEDGQRGLDRAIEAQPELICSDIEMPIMNGIAMCRSLKSDPRTRHIPVIFFSTLDRIDDVVQGMQVGAADYLSKNSQTDEGFRSMASMHLKLARRQQRPRDEGPVAAPTAPSGQTPWNAFWSMEMGVAVVDLGRRPLFVNEVGRKALGIPVGADLGDATLDGFPERMSALASQFYESTSRDAASGFVTIPMEGRPIAIRLEPLVDDNREIISLLVLISPQARP